MVTYSALIYDFVVICGSFRMFDLERLVYARIGDCSCNVQLLRSDSSSSLLTGDGFVVLHLMPCMGMSLHTFGSRLSLVSHACKDISLLHHIGIDD